MALPAWPVSGHRLVCYHAAGVSHGGGAAQEVPERTLTFDPLQYMLQMRLPNKDRRNMGLMDAQLRGKRCAFEAGISAKLSAFVMRNFNTARHYWPLVPLVCAVAGLATAANGEPGASRTNDQQSVVVSDGWQAPVIERYLPIISRMPFGAPPSLPPPPPVAVTPVQHAAADLARSFVLSAITRSPAGNVMVGFTDNAAKPPRNLLLAVGEESDDYRVVAADLDSETATLEKDGISVELRLSSTPVPPSHAVGEGMYATPPPILAGTPQGQQAISMGQTNNSSYLLHLQNHQEQQAKQAEEERVNALAKARAQTTEVIDKRLREANLTLLHKNLKPISTITLSPEEDAKLVAEGVLPPP